MRVSVRLASLCLADLGHPATARAAAEALLGPARHVPQRAIVGAVAIAGGALLVADAAHHGAIEAGCAWAAARTWLRLAGLDDDALVVRLAAELHDRLRPPAASGVRTA